MKIIKDTRMQKKGAEQVLKYIVKYIKKNGYAPCMREIAKDNNIKSASSVFYIINYLEYEGYIRCTPIISRGIVVLEEKFRGGKKISNKVDKVSRK